MFLFPRHRGNLRLVVRAVRVSLAANVETTIGTPGLRLWVAGFGATGSWLCLPCLVTVVLRLRSRVNLRLCNLVAVYVCIHLLLPINYYQYFWRLP